MKIAIVFPGHVFLWTLVRGGGMFPGESFTRYLGLALVFAWGGALWEGFDFCFSEAFQGFFFRGIGKVLIFLFGGGGTVRRAIILWG